MPALRDGVVDGRTDVHAIACVLYEMLAGDPPYAGSSAHQVLTRIVVDRARPLREIRNSVPRNVDAAVATALEKLPADRFQSAGAFGEALADEDFRGDTAHRTTLTHRASGWKRWAITDLATTLLFVLLAGWGWPGPTNDGPARRLVRATIETPMPPPGAPWTGPTVRGCPSGLRTDSRWGSSPRAASDG